MAITFVGESNDANGPTGGQVHTPPEPAGAQENDLIIGFSFVNSTGRTLTKPNDFTQLTVKENTSTMGLFYKVRGATEGDGYTFSYDGNPGSSGVTLVTYRGVDTANPFDVTYSEANHYEVGTNQPNLAAAAITTVTNNAWVLLLELIQATISGQAGPPSGYTEDADYMTGAGGGRGQYVCHKQVVSAGTETPGAFTHVDTNGTADPRIFTLALRPALSGGGGIILPMFQTNNLNSFIRS